MREREGEKRNVIACPIRVAFARHGLTKGEVQSRTIDGQTKNTGTPTRDS
jgi:hypothetical protein